MADVPAASQVGSPGPAVGYPKESFGVHRKQKGGDDAKRIDPDREACMNSRPRRAIIVDAVQRSISQ